MAMTGSALEIVCFLCEPRTSAVWLRTYEQKQQLVVGVPLVFGIFTLLLEGERALKLSAYLAYL